MIGSLVRKLVGSKNERDLKRLQPLVDRINSLEAEIAALPDETLRARTGEFRQGKKFQGQKV
jgi:preprotein translocase subunit SecA